MRLGNLGKRPIAPNVQVENLPLVLGQESPVPFQKRHVSFPGAKGVKAHTLTAYRAPRRDARGPAAQGFRTLDAWDLI